MGDGRAVGPAPGLYRYDSQQPPLQFPGTPLETFRAVYQACRKVDDVAKADERTLTLRLRADATGGKPRLWVEPAEDGRGSTLCYRVEVTTREPLAVERISRAQHERVHHLELEAWDRVRAGLPSPPAPESAPPLSKGAAMVLIATAVVTLLVLAVAVLA